MKIEWASHVSGSRCQRALFQHVLITGQFAPDGSRRSPPPSIIHGWLAKWRGTLSGNEHLRSRVSIPLIFPKNLGLTYRLQGMAEMRRAAAYRKARKVYKQKKAEKYGTSRSGGLFSFFRRNKAPVTRRATRLSTRPRTQSTRPSRSSRHKGSQQPSRQLTTSRKFQPNSSHQPRHKRLPPRSRHQPKPQQHTSTRRPHGRR